MMLEVPAVVEHTLILSRCHKLHMSSFVTSPPQHRCSLYNVCNGEGRHRYRYPCHQLNFPKFLGAFVVSTSLPGSWLTLSTLLDTQTRT